MKKAEITHQDLQEIREFLKKKKITLKTLSKEMDYSNVQVINVFNGYYTITPKFGRRMIFAIEKILQRDLNEFFDFIGEKRWITFIH